MAPSDYVPRKPEHVWGVADAGGGLSPDRRHLAQLHARNRQIEAAEAEPRERQANSLKVIAAADAARAHVVRLTTAYSERCEEAIANRWEMPEKPHDLVRAEGDAIRLDERRGAAQRVYDRAGEELHALGELRAALGPQLATAALRVIAEECEEGVRGAPALAWLTCQREFSPYTGVAEVLRGRGASDTEAWQTADRIEKAIRATTLARVAPDTAAARAFIAALDSDSQAVLSAPIDGNGVCASNLPSPGGTTSEGEAAHPGANTAMVEVPW